MRHKNITLRAPVELIDAIDRLAQEESAKTGLPVTPSAIIRRAIERDLAREQVTLQLPTSPALGMQVQGRIKREQKKGGDGK